MSDSYKHSFDRLRKQLFGSKRGFHSLSEIRDVPHLLAVAANAFKNKFVEPEPIYGRDGFIAHEFLSRPNADGSLLKDHLSDIGTITESFYSSGHGVCIDEVLCRNALDNAPTDSPFTLNISTASLQSPEFFERMEEPLSAFRPQNVIWEVLEHGIDRCVNLNHLYDMKDRGYSFWLDDFTISPPDTNKFLAPEHQSRIDVLVRSGLAQVIKFDGSMVRAGLGCTKTDTKHTIDCLRRAIDYIQENFPDIELVAECVKSRAEADILFDMGFIGVQGFDLDPRDFHYMAEKDTQLEFETPPLI